MRTISAPNTRRGFSLLEMIVATLLLGVVFVTVAPLLRWVAAERRAAAQRQVALVDVGNLMEQISQKPWDEITAEPLGRMSLREETQRLLKHPQLTVTVDPDNGPLEAKRITIELTWRNREGDPVPPLRLTTWFYRQSGANP